MTLQAVASPITVILTTLEVSFMFLETIYSSGVAYNCHLQFLQATSLSYTEKSFIKSVPELSRKQKILKNKNEKKIGEETN